MCRDTQTRWVRFLLIGALGLAQGATLVTHAVAAAAPDSPGADPVQCWWRPSTSAVRIGQRFSLLLTCAIGQSDGQRVVVDQGKLSPEAIPLSPFEVVDGGDLVESTASDRRFFQRDYRVRVVIDNAFGQDVLIPAVVVTYRLETESAAGGRNQGIERRHELPALPIRVLSLVPADARDIREAPIATFADLDDAAFRASLVETGGLALLGIGAVGLVVALASAARSRRPKASARAGLTDHQIVRQIARDLHAVRQAREQDSWSPALIARALAILRVIASYVDRREPSQRHAEIGETVPDGVVMYDGGDGTRIMISAAITSTALRSDAAASEESEHRAAVRDALVSLTQAHYGHAQRIDAAALDAALDVASQAVVTLKRQRTWLARTRAAAAARLRVPSRIPWFR
jgi:hypothetical protein